MSRDDDWESITRFKDGNLAAFSELVERYERVVFNCAFRIVGDMEDAADVAQSVFLKLYQHVESVDSSRPFFSWLYRVAVNEAFDHKRKKRPHDVFDEEVVETTDSSPDLQLVQRDREVVLMRSMDHLSEEQRSVIVLRHFVELSYRDIAGVLDIPESQVKSRLYAARQRLKDILLKTGGID